MSDKIKIGKRSKGGQIKLFGKVMDFSGDPFSTSARITLIGNNEAVVDGCYGIVEYNDCLVKINVGNRVACFSGCDFIIGDYTDTSLVLKGIIQSIEFC